MWEGAYTFCRATPKILKILKNRFLRKWTFCKGQFFSKMAHNFGNFFSPSFSDWSCESLCKKSANLHFSFRCYSSRKLKNQDFSVFKIMWFWDNLMVKICFQVMDPNIFMPEAPREFFFNFFSPSTSIVFGHYWMRSIVCWCCGICFYLIWKWKLCVRSE